MPLLFPTNPTPGTTSNGGLSGGFQSWTWDGIAWKLAATPFVATSSTITSDMITNGTIVDADVSGTAAIALSKIQPVTATNGGLVPAAHQIHVQNSSNAAVSASVGGDLTATVSGTAINFAIATGVIVNSDISSSAGIVSSKFAANGYSFSSAAVTLAPGSGNTQFSFTSISNLGIATGGVSSGAVISTAGFYLISLRITGQGANMSGSGVGSGCFVTAGPSANPGIYRSVIQSGSDQFAMSFCMQLSVSDIVKATVFNSTTLTITYDAALDVRLISL